MNMQIGLHILIGFDSIQNLDKFEKLEIFRKSQFNFEKMNMRNCFKYIVNEDAIKFAFKRSLFSNHFIIHSEFFAFDTTNGFD